ncbi:hypothetical protein DFH06DRAFT_1202591 [Mycena polygramma]|nr:hypothetical protein DFH06DRAFT_1202591 [Mycena polygramma]
MAESGTKRRRTEDAPTISRSDIWYQDGSVVLQAEATQFRVHWGVLTQNSSFFRDMQALPQPPEQPTVEGCPIVELHDSCADVKYLLATLYDPTILFQKGLPMVVVAALLRLGRKYDFRKLLDAAVELVMHDNPTTLEDFLNRTTSKISHYNVIDMLTLVRENNIKAAQPSAYYSVVRHCTHRELFDGVPRIDGTLASLAPDDLRQCNLGRDLILAKQMLPGCTVGFLSTWDYQADCVTVQLCAKRREKILQKILQSRKAHAFDVGEQQWEHSFCDQCFGHLETRIAAGRKKMWEELPSFFDLPPWNELKNDL